jgi:dihydroflavonol-4-reductase
VRVAVTGASGLVGAHVLTALVDRGHSVRSLTHRATPDSDSEADTAVIDVTHPESLRAALDGIDAVVHCAAPYSYDLEPAQLQSSAVDGTRNVLTAAAAVGARRVVITSSSVTCGSASTAKAVDESHEPRGEYEPAYFRAKWDQEQVALELGPSLGIEVVVACPTVVLGGPDRRLVPSNAIVARYLRDVTRTTYPGGCNVVAATDVGTGHVLLLENGVPGRRYLLGGENLTWPELHALVSELTGLPGPYSQAPASIVSALAIAAAQWGRLTDRPPFVTEQEAATIGRFYWYCSDLARSLGYRPASARTAVAQSLASLLASEHLPGWVRGTLRVAPEVYEARPLRPRPLDLPARTRRPRRVPVRPAERPDPE